jgi:hypothetical protein
VFSQVKKTGAFFAAVVIFSALGLGIASASIPESSGVIKGCYNSSGSLSVIDSGMDQSCSSGSTSLNWYQAGGDGAEVVYSASTALNSSYAYGECPVGMQAVGGGYAISYGAEENPPEPYIYAQYPATVGSHSSWSVEWSSVSGDTTDTIQAFAVCLPTGA